MAPGARPVNPKKASAAKAEGGEPSEKASRRPASGAGRFDKAAARTATASRGEPAARGRTARSADEPQREAAAGFRARRGGSGPGGKASGASRAGTPRGGSPGGGPGQEAVREEGRWREVGRDHGGQAGVAFRRKG